VHYSAGSHDDCALHEILKFADIAWPIMVLQSLQQVVGDVIDGLAITLSKGSSKMLYQERYVVFSFP
jgi:hypothetical protein